MERGGYTAATTYASSYNIRFSSCPKRNCNGRPFRLANFKKQLFRASKVVFFDFPSRHPWEQAVSFWGAFPASQSAIAMGDPSNWQISKNNFSEPEKLFFWFSPSLESRQWAFQVLFQLPKAQLQWETLPTGKFQKTTFQALKSCFLKFASWKVLPLQLRFGQLEKHLKSSLPALKGVWMEGKIKKTTFQSLRSCFFDFPFQKIFRGRERTRLVPQKPRELRILMERGEVINYEFRFSEARYTI